MKEQLRDGRCRRGMTAGDNETYGGEPVGNATDGQESGTTTNSNAAQSSDPSNSHPPVPVLNSLHRSSGLPGLLNAKDELDPPTTNEEAILKEWRARLQERGAGLKRPVPMFGEPIPMQDEDSPAPQQQQEDKSTTAAASSSSSSASASSSSQVNPSPEGLSADGQTPPSQVEGGGDKGTGVANATASNSTTTTTQANGTQTEPESEEVIAARRKEAEIKKKEEEKKKKKKEEEEEKKRRDEEERKRDEAIAAEDPILVSLNDLTGCEDLMEKLYEHYTKKTRNKYVRGLLTLFYYYYYFQYCI